MKGDRNRNKQALDTAVGSEREYLRLALLTIDYLGGYDLCGGGLRAGAQAFGLRDDHLGDGSGGSDDGGLGSLDGLKALLTLGAQRAHRLESAPPKNNEA